MASQNPSVEIKQAKERKVLHDFIDTPFTERVGAEALATMYNYKNLNINMSTTNHYTNPGQTNSQLPVARTPIFHPYNPSAPANTITVRCPNEFLSFIPQGPLRNLLISLKLPSKNYNISFVTQNVPNAWIQNKKEPLLFRPQYYVNGIPHYENAIKSGVFNCAHPCSIGIFSTSKTTLKMDNTINSLAPAKLMVSSHSSGKKPSQIISSPSKPGIISGMDFKISNSLFSVVITPGGRVGLTLHWLLNPEDQALINLLSHRVKNLRELIVEIEKLGPKTTLNAPQGPMANLRDLFCLKGVELSKGTEKKLLGDKAPKAAKADKSKGLSLSEDDERQKMLVRSKPGTHGESKSALELEEIEAILLQIKEAEHNNQLSLMPASHEGPESNASNENNESHDDLNNGVSGVKDDSDENVVVISDITPTVAATATATATEVKAKNERENEVAKALSLDIKGKSKRKVEDNKLKLLSHGLEKTGATPASSSKVETPQYTQLKNAAKNSEKLRKEAAKLEAEWLAQISLLGELGDKKIEHAFDQHLFIATIAPETSNEELQNMILISSQELKVMIDYTKGQQESLKKIQSLQPKSAGAPSKKAPAKKK